MYSHPGQDYGDGGHTQYPGRSNNREAGQMNAAESEVAAFMRNINPDAGSNGSGPSRSNLPGGVPTPFPSRGGPTGRPRKTRPMATAAHLPSTRDFAPVEPSNSGDLTGMRVAVGTVYETSSHGSSSSPAKMPAASAGFASSSPYDDSTDPYPADASGPPPPAGVPFAGNLKKDISDSELLPNAPYQDMLNRNDQVDAAMAEAQRQRDSRGNQRPPDLPFPKAALPQAPTTQAVEPPVPSSRLGRRMLTDKPSREPDVCVARMLPPGQQRNSANPAGFGQLSCGSCRAPLLVANTAILVKCPNCSRVLPVASCRGGRSGR